MTAWKVTTLDMKDICANSWWEQLMTTINMWLGESRLIELKSLTREYFWSFVPSTLSIFLVRKFTCLWSRKLDNMWHWVDSDLSYDDNDQTSCWKTWTTLILRYTKKKLQPLWIEVLEASFHQAFISEVCESSTSSDFLEIWDDNSLLRRPWCGEWYDHVTMILGYWINNDVRVILNDFHLILLPWWIDSDTKWWLNSHKKVNMS